MGSIFSHKNNLSPYLLPGNCPYIHNDHLTPYNSYPYLSKREFYNQNCNSSFMYPFGPSYNSLPHRSPGYPMYQFDPPIQPLIPQQNIFPNYPNTNFNPSPNNNYSLNNASYNNSPKKRSSPKQEEKVHYKASKTRSPIRSLSSCSYTSKPSRCRSSSRKPSHCRSSSRKHYIDPIIQANNHQNKENRLRRYLKLEEAKVKQNKEHFLRQYLIKEEKNLKNNMRNLHRNRSFERKPTKSIKVPKIPLDSHINKSLTELGYSLKDPGRHNYRCFVPFKSDYEWKALLTKIKHSLLGIQSLYNVTIAFSRQVFVFRGYPIRTMDITGHNKSNLYKCRAALPEALSEIIITEKGEDFVSTPLVHKIRNRATKIPFRG